MRTPVQRVRSGAIVLLAAVLVGVVGYRVLGDYSWIESLWMVIITVSTVGYSEHSQSTTSVQLLTLAVIMVGMSSAVYTFSGFFQLWLEGELELALGVRRMNRQIEQLRDHVIICGMGRSGRSLAADLRHRGRELVVIEIDEDKIEDASELDALVIDGDAREESVLQKAGIEHASALVSALPSDADNVFITLTAREMNPNIRIVASAEYESTAKKLHQAGAQKVVMPSRVSALQMSRMILNPSAADLMELIAESSYLDLELDEVKVGKHAALVGLTVNETEAHRKHKILVIAVRQKDGSMIFNPDAEYAFAADDIAILMGNRKQIDHFRSLFCA